MVDSLASGASVRKDVRVRLPPRAPRRDSKESLLFCQYSLTKTGEALGIPVDRESKGFFVILAGLDGILLYGKIGIK